MFIQSLRLDKGQQNPERSRQRRSYISVSLKPAHERGEKKQDYRRQELNGKLGIRSQHPAPLLEFIREAFWNWILEKSTREIVRTSDSLEGLKNV